MTALTSSRVPAERRAEHRYWLADPFDVRLRLDGRPVAASVINVSAAGVCLRVAARIPPAAAVLLELDAEPIPLRTIWSLAGAKDAHGTLGGFASVEPGVDLVQRLAAVGHALEDPYGAGGEG